MKENSKNLYENINNTNVSEDIEELSIEQLDEISGGAKLISFEMHHQTCTYGPSGKRCVTHSSGQLK